MAMNEVHRPKPFRMTVFLPIISGVFLVWLIASFVDFANFTLQYLIGHSIFLFMSPFILCGGILLLRYRPNIGHVVIGLGAALALLWIYMTESATFSNSWIALNASEYFYNQLYVHYSKLRIICVALLLITLLCSITRLFPSDWCFRNRAISERTWPAIVITALFMVCWFAKSVIPYRQPIIIDAMESEIKILHVTKDSLTFHETYIGIFGNGKYYIAKNNRELFHYSFQETTAEGVLTENLQAEARAIQTLPELKQISEKSPKALRALRAEGWYVDQHSRGTVVASFTTENSTLPPKQLVDFVQDIENAPLHGQVWHSTIRDVCLQFCYDPIAGLGYRAENQRCRTGLDNKEHCL